MQLFNESRLLKCFNFENVLFEWKHSKYFLFKRKQITRVFALIIPKMKKPSIAGTIVSAWVPQSPAPQCKFPLTAGSGKIAVMLTVIGGLTGGTLTPVIFTLKPRLMLTVKKNKPQNANSKLHYKP